MNKMFYLLITLFITNILFSQNKIISEGGKLFKKSFSKTKNNAQLLEKDSVYDVKGRWGWGLNHAVATDGNYIYIGNGEVFQILDATDPSNLKVAGEITLN